MSDFLFIPDNGFERRAKSNPPTPPADKNLNRGLQNTSLACDTDLTMTYTTSAGEKDIPIMVKPV